MRVLSRAALFPCVHVHYVSYVLLYEGSWELVSHAQREEAHVALPPGFMYFTLRTSWDTFFMNFHFHILKISVWKGGPNL